MGPSESGGDFVVEEPEPGVYNPTGAEPPVWQPAPQDVLDMFELLETEQVIPAVDNLKQFIAVYDSCGFARMVIPMDTR